MELIMALNVDWHKPQGFSSRCQCVPDLITFLNAKIKLARFITENNSFTGIKIGIFSFLSPML
jgi:hypothetical protein